MFLGIFCGILFSSCQTRPLTQAPFLLFKGEWTLSQISKKPKKQGALIEIYLDKKTPAIRIDLINLWGQAFFIFIWDGEGYFALLPLESRYFKEKTLRFKAEDQELLALFKNPSWLKPALMGRKIPDWGCGRTKKEGFKKCRKGPLLVERLSRKFLQKSLRISLKKKDYHLRIQLSRAKSPSLAYEKVFQIAAPPHFERLKELDTTGWK